MYRTAHYARELISFTVRRRQMEEKIEKEEVLGFFMVFIKEGFFMEARIVLCCNRSFMNECTMYSI